MVNTVIAEPDPFNDIRQTAVRLQTVRLILEYAGFTTPEALTLITQIARKRNGQ